MFSVLLQKELAEQLRTRRALLLAAVLVLFGLGSPLLAELAPEMVKSIGETREGVVISIPPAALADGLEQYIKNISQFGVLMAVILWLGAVAGEKERGTALFTLSRPAGRGSFLLAKLAAQFLTLIACMAPAAAGCYFYSAVLFEAPDVASFLAITALLILFIVAFMAMTLLASTLARTTAAAAGLSIAGVVLLVVLGTLPTVGEWMPAGLLGWARELAAGAGNGAAIAGGADAAEIAGGADAAEIAGGADAAEIAGGQAGVPRAAGLIGSAGLIILFCSAACIRFRREEL